MTIGIGFIGTGEIAMIHAEALRRLAPKINIAAAHDVNEANVRFFARKTGAKICHSVAELLASDIGAVYICTRHDSHYEFVAKAVAAGKAIFCEKPLALDVTEAEKMREMVTKSGLPFAIGYNHRCAPGLLDMQEQLGTQKPKMMHISLVTAPFLHTWAGLPKIGGGILPCLGSHILDLARCLMQEEPLAIGVFSARLRLPDPHLHDSAVGILRFPQNRLVSLHFHDQGTHEYCVDPGRALITVQIFAEGRVIAGHTLNDWVFQVKDQLQAKQAPAQEHIASWGYLNINRRFLACLEGKKDEVRPPTIEDGYQAARLVHAAGQAAASGQIIRL